MRCARSMPFSRNRPCAGTPETAAPTLGQPVFCRSADPRPDEEFAQRVPAPEDRTQTCREAPKHHQRQHACAGRNTPLAWQISALPRAKSRSSGMSFPWPSPTPGPASITDLGAAQLETTSAPFSFPARAGQVDGVGTRLPVGLLQLDTAVKIEDLRPDPARQGQHAGAVLRAVQSKPGPSGRRGPDRTTPPGLPIVSEAYGVTLVQPQVSSAGQRPTSSSQRKFSPHLRVHAGMVASLHVSFIGANDLLNLEDAVLDLDPLADLFAIAADEKACAEMIRHRGRPHPCLVLAIVATRPEGGSGPRKGGAGAHRSGPPPRPHGVKSMRGNGHAIAVEDSSCPRATAPYLSGQGHRRLNFPLAPRDPI